MASYVNDLRLKEIGTGESSGTWGTETNTNPFNIFSLKVSLNQTPES